jgi:Membrane transport protein
LSGAKYGILAGISSFIFQLPLQLFLFECHLLEEEHLAANNSTGSSALEDEREDAVAPKATPLPVEEENHDDVSDPECVLENVNLSIHSTTRRHESDARPKGKEREQYVKSRFCLWATFASRGDIWRKIFYKLLRNPVLWAIVVGFVLTLSTLGPAYLNEKSSDFVPGLGFISETLDFIGSTVTPVSLFTMGVWMQNQGNNGRLFQLSAVAAVGYMVSKLVLVPFIMVGLAKALNLSDEPGRAAVLIASLPISMASFSLANRYGAGEAVMAENVTLGTLFILPTVIIWNLLMDKMGLFPAQAE